MKKNRIYILTFVCIILSGQAYGLAEITGGRDVTVSGDGASYGERTVMSCGADPAITLGLTSISSLYGQGIISHQLVGSQSLSISLGGFDLSVGYDGEVKTSMELSSAGSASTTAFVGATATGLSTGKSSYDMFGTADISTMGYISGQGVGEAYAKGSSSYGVSKQGAPSEIWGRVEGESNLQLETSSAGGLANTGGEENGLHADSRATETIAKEQKASSYSKINSYASVINQAKATVSSSGQAQCGAWDSSFSGGKVRLSNENAASSAIGKVRGYVEANGENDAADVSSILEASAIKDGALEVSGGPATYAASSQSSSSPKTYAETWVEDASWGSVVRTNDNKVGMEWGVLSGIGSGAPVSEAGTNALSFGKVLLKTDYKDRKSTGNLTLSTYAEATNGKQALPGSIIGPDGSGTVWFSDGIMSNIAKFEGGLYHYSFIDSGATPPWAETHAVLTRAFVDTYPGGNESLEQPFEVNTLGDPIVAWSRTDGYYEQSD